MPLHDIDEQLVEEILKTLGEAALHLRVSSKIFQALELPEVAGMFNKTEVMAQLTGNKLKQVVIFGIPEPVCSHDSLQTELQRTNKSKLLCPKCDQIVFRDYSNTI